MVGLIYYECCLNNGTILFRNCDKRAVVAFCKNYLKSFKRALKIRVILIKDVISANFLIDNDLQIDLLNLL